MLQRSSASASASCFSTKILELGVATNFSAISKCKLLLDNITNLLLDAEAEARRAAGRPPEGRRRRHRRVAVREQREGEEDVGVVVEPARPPRPRRRRDAVRGVGAEARQRALAAQQGGRGRVRGGGGRDRVGRGRRPPVLGPPAQRVSGGERPVTVPSAARFLRRSFMVSSTS